MLLLLASIAITAPCTASTGQGLVAPWALRSLEERVRADPRPEDLHDLAELWARIAEDEEQRALAAHVAAFDACVEARGAAPSAGATSCGTLEPDLAPALAAWRRSESRSLQLLRDHPDHDAVPEAVHRLAWAWRRLGRDALSAAAFTWVGAASADAEVAEAAWVQVGEQAFEGWELEEAAAAYALAARSEGRLRAWALHRRAWSLYRLGELDAGIDTMKEVVLAAAAAEEAGEADPYELRDLALRDLLLWFEEAGSLDELHCGHGCDPELVRRLLHRLATLQEEHGRFEAAVQTRRRLIAEAPGDTPENAALQVAIVRGTAAGGRADAVLAELERYWRTYPRSGEAQAAELGAVLRESALELHERALSDADTQSLGTALALYDTYLATHDSHHHEVAYWRASLLEALGRTEEALAAYLANLRDHPNARYTRALQAAVLRLGGSLPPGPSPP